MSGTVFMGFLLAKCCLVGYQRISSYKKKIYPSQNKLNTAKTKNNIYNKIKEKKSKTCPNEDYINLDMLFLFYQKLPF